ncbi:MAG: hypothetical protein E6K70_04355 [Planctomycetota bacterium]|nr:MAG: hypothetical protein E6K70_04355 [Planctomycetota bacterium]
MSQGRRKPLVYALVTLGLSILGSSLVPAQEIIRFTYDVPGDSKPVVVHADAMATWTEDNERIILLKGKVLVEHGVVQAHMDEAVIWLDLEHQRRTGIQRLEVYAQGNVILENGPETRKGAQALFGLSTRGEIKLRSHNGKVLHEAYPGEPLYRKGRQVRSRQSSRSGTGQTQRAAYLESTLPFAEAGSRSGMMVARGSAPEVVPAQGSALPAAPGPGPNPAPSPPPNVTPSPTGPTGTGPPPGTLPLIRPAQIPVPGARALPPGQRALLDAPGREFSIVGRTSAGFNPQSFSVNGETAIVITGGVILIVRTLDGSSLIDIEADKLVFWTKGNPQELLGNLSSQRGQRSKELEFYLAGDVQIRSHTGKEDRLLQSDEVYYDVGRNVAIAMHADMEFKQPNIPDPVHMKAEELQMLSENLFKGMKAEMFSSRLPSDPGLKVYVADATLERKLIPKKSIFGRQFINRQTGQPETEEQRLFDGRTALLKVEDYPIFYLPFVQGDLNDPLGPLESVSFNYNKIFGFQFTSSFNVYDLLGLDPIAGTRWRFDADVLTARGPALGTTYDYAAKEFFSMPAVVTDLVKAYGIYDTGKDVLGGGRGELDNHPAWRGRFLWQNNVQDLPAGFSIQSQVSLLSDPNFLEQYYKNEFDTGLNQETFLYVKQQQNNWAWTVLGEPYLRNWVTETEWLPRADGYLIGQSFFDLFTYNAHASAGYARLRTTDVPPPPVEITDQTTNTFRFDLMQELSLPFTLGPFRLVPYGKLDLTYYSEDLEGTDRGRIYGGGGLRGSIPFTRLYPDIQSDLLNVNGINHKIVISGNYYIAESDTPFTRLPQLDRLNDDATDQALRDIKPREPALNPAHGLALEFSPVYDPQLYALRRLVDDRIDTLDTIEVLQGDIRQRWQTKRGYPGQQHTVDWMTLDLSASFFPHSNRDNFGENFAFLQYDWTWNVGDRTALVSNGWVDPETDGPRVFNVGAFLNRPDRTSFYVGYRQIDPLQSKAVTGSATYIFSPKYAMTAMVTYDFGVNMELTSLMLTRMGSDLQVSVGITYNSILSTVGATFEIIPNIVPPNKRIPGLAGLSPNAMR